MKFETGKTYEVVKSFKGLSVGTTFTIDGVTYGTNLRGDLVKSTLGWITTVAFKSRLGDGYMKEVKSKMTLDEIANSKETFVAVREDGGSIIYSNGLFGGFSKHLGQLHVFSFSREDFRQWVLAHAKMIYLATDYQDGTPVWSVESEEDARKREQLEKLGKDIETLTEPYNKLKNELK